MWCHRASLLLWGLGLWELGLWVRGCGWVIWWVSLAIQLLKTRAAHGPSRQAGGSGYLAPRSSPPAALPVPGAAGSVRGSLAAASSCP